MVYRILDLLPILGFKFKNCRDHTNKKIDEMRIWNIREVKRTQIEEIENVMKSLRKFLKALELFLVGSRRILES